MKTFTHAAARDLRQAVMLAEQAHQDGRSASFAGGGSDLLGLVKERIVRPDVIVSLKGVKGLDEVAAEAGGLVIGGEITLDALSRNPLVQRQYAVLAEAAGGVATPQIRNVGTLAGNVCQRPWCWYYRNGFPCYKAGGNTCFSYTGENQFHAIFGGGPSYIVHPSDTAPALLALDAKFRVLGPAGERSVPAADFFVLPRQNPARENVLGAEDVLAAVLVPRLRPGTRSTYHKVLDREAWTHAVVSAAVVLEMDQQVCRSARVVLGGVAPIPWRLPEVEKLLAGQRITGDLAARAGEAAVAGARPLARNGYKVPLTKAVVQRTILDLAART
jgi:xanthine dehydrogenase YagS FAD-binding subunit